MFFLYIFYVPILRIYYYSWSTLLAFHLLSRACKARQMCSCSFAYKRYSLSVNGSRPFYGLSVLRDQGDDCHIFIFHHFCVVQVAAIVIIIMKMSGSLPSFVKTPGLGLDFNRLISNMNYVLRCAKGLRV